MQTEPITTQEAIAPNSTDFVPPPENVAEPATSAVAAHSQSIPVDPRPTETVPTTPEPQNKLTQKFTEAEWKALIEFRVCVLPPNASSSDTFSANRPNFMMPLQKPTLTNRTRGKHL
jgi:hypothetical protein